jgi:hypothetical protein
MIRILGLGLTIIALYSLIICGYIPFLANPFIGDKSADALRGFFVLTLPPMIIFIWGWHKIISNGDNSMSDKYKVYVLIGGLGMAFNALLLALYSK